MIAIILERYTFKKFFIILINIRDFNVSKFNIFYLTFFIKFNIILNNKAFYLISSKEEIIKITFSTNKTRDTLLYK